MNIFQESTTARRKPSGPRVAGNNSISGILIILYPFCRSLRRGRQLLHAAHLRRHRRLHPPGVLSLQAVAMTACMTAMTAFMTADTAYPGLLSLQAVAEKKNDTFQSFILSRKKL